MIRLVVPAVALAALAAPGVASDPRLVERMYDEGKVVRVEGRTNVQATIAFGDDEQIENIAIGNSNAWQVTPNRRANLLFVKPTQSSASTNMTVVTNKHTYLFDLVANPKARPLYVLRFKYPEPPEEPAPVVAATEPTEEELALAQLPAEPEVASAEDPYVVSDPAALNFAWTSKGAAQLLPTRTFDNGHATFLAWPVGQPMPAILIKDVKGVEGPVNFAVRGDTVVIDGVPREIVLRSGKDMATLINTGPASAAPARSAALARTDTKPAGEVK